MNKLIASLQILASVALACIAVATLVNMVLISMRPETISVVNTIVGQGVIIVCMVALATILFRKGLQGFRSAGTSEQASD